MTQPRAYVKSTPEERALACDLYRDGWSAGQIAAYVGCHPQLVYYWLRQAGIPRRSKSEAGLSPRRGRAVEEAIA